MANDILTLDEQFGNNGTSNMAFSYQPLPPSPLPNQSLFPDWVNNIKSPSISDDIRPEINSIVQDMRFNTLNLLQNKGKSGVDSVLEQMFPTNNKIELSYDVPITDTHELLSDGKTWIPKYKNYLPGANNEERNAMMQSNWEKFFNPLKRGAVKVGRGIFADIGSFVYGIGEAAITGRAESVFDNDMSNYIDDLDKKTDFNFKNYYTEAQNGLGANLYTWDKVLGGAEFTARMLGAEAIIAAATGGASLPASFARAGARLGLEAGVDAFKIFRTAEKIEDIAEIGANASKIGKLLKKPIVSVAEKGGAIFSGERYAKGLESAINAGKLADNLKQARFAVTGSMYEAGFEARHYQQDAENAFWDYYRQKGTQPTEEDINKFYSKLDNTSWGVFGANMAILSASNLALFGNMMNIKNPFPKLTDGSFLNKNLFKIGTEVGKDGLWKPMTANFFNKAAAFASPVVKGAAIEGVFEEGGQGIASNMMKNYIASTYDPKAMRETSDYMSSFTKAFKDQFSTKSGVEEIVIGGIIGGLFGGIHGSSEVRNEYKSQPFVAKVQNAMPQVAENIVSNLYTNENLSNIIGHANRLQNINKQQEISQSNGDMIGDALHSAESFVSMLQASSSVGKTDEFMDILKASLRGMDNSKIAEGHNIKLEDVDSFKEDKIKGIEKISEDYNKAREAGGFLFGGGKIGGFYEIDGKKINRQNLIDSFAYISTMGNVSQQLASDSFNAFQQKLAEIGTNQSIVEEFGSIAALQTAGNVEIVKLKQADNESKRLKSEQKKLEDEILVLQKSENSPETTQRLQEVSEKLINIGNELNEASNKKDLYWKSIVDNFYSKLGKTGYLPQIDFDNFNKKISDLKEILGDNNSISEYDRFELNKILEQYDKANSTFKSFSELGKSLVNPKFTYKIYNNIFSGIRAKKDKSLNDLTKQTLLDLYNTNTKISETLLSFQPEESPITEEIIKSVNEDENYTPPTEIINYISDKIKSKKELSDNDKIVYNKFKNIIEDSVKKVEEDPINADTKDTEIDLVKVKILDIEGEISQLQNGIVTDSIREEYDNLENEINNSDDDLIKQELKLNQDRLILDRIDELKETIDDIKNNEDNKIKIENKKNKLSEKINKLKNEIYRDILSKYEASNSIKNIKDVKDLPIYELERIKENDSSELEKFKLFLDNFDPNKNYSPSEIKEILQSQNLLNNKKTARIWDSIENGANLLGVKIRFSDQFINNVEEDTGGFYAHDSNTIIITVGNLIGNGYSFEHFSSIVQHIVTHELIHGVTARVTSNYENVSKKTRDQIDKLSNLLPKLRTYAKKINGEYYGLTNIDELMAEMANENFRKFVNYSNTEFFGGLLSILGFNTGRQGEIRKIIDYLKNASIQEDISQYYSNMDKYYENVVSPSEKRYEELNSEIEKRLKELSKEPYYNKVKKLRKLESELKDLNEVKDDFNPGDSYYNQLEWILKNSNIINFENVDSLSSLEKPSEDDINRYVELTSKKRKSKEDKIELNTLRDKLLPYKIVENSEFGGVPLLDIIDLYNQLKSYKDIQENQVENLPEDDMKNAISEVQNQEYSPEFRSANVGLVYDGTFIKGGGEIKKLYHIKLNTILDFALNKKMDVVIQEFKTENGNIIYGDEINVNDSNVSNISEKYDNFNGVRILIGDDIIMEKSENGTSFSVSGDIASLMDLKPYDITGQSTSYHLLYEQKLDGSYAPKESEFEVKRDGVVIPFDRNSLNSLQKDDSVTLFFDINDDYNKILNKKDYASKGNIYVMKNGNLINILKAKSNYETENGGWAELNDIRKKVVKSSMDNNKSISVKIKGSYMGLPIIKIDSNGKAIENEINEDKIHSYGYIDANGKYVFFKNNIKVDNSQYTDPYLELNKIIPIMAFNYNGKIYTFPIQIRPKGINVQNELDSILNNTSLMESQKMLKVNGLLEKYNLESKELAWTSQNNTIDKIKSALNSVVEKIDLTNEKEYMEADKTSYIDLNDPFMNSKLIFDFKSVDEILTESEKDKNIKIKPISDKGKNISDENIC